MSLVLSMTCGSFTFADSQQQLLSCSKVSGDTNRLACYDRIVSTLTKEKIVDNKATETVIPKTVLAAPPKKMNPAPAPEVESSQDSKIVYSDARTIQKIEARLIGDFKGWNKYSIFKLDNGQIWRAVRSNARTKKMGAALKDPKVTITRGAIGSYDLRIEGVFGKLKVKRVK